MPIAGNLEFGDTGSGYIAAGGGGISSSSSWGLKRASVLPTSDLRLQEEAGIVNWKLGQLQPPYYSHGSSHEGPAAARHKMHGGKYGWSTELSAAGINIFGHEESEQLLKVEEAGQLELQPGSREASCTPPPTTSCRGGATSQAAAGSDSFMRANTSSVQQLLPSLAGTVNGGSGQACAGMISKRRSRASRRVPTTVMHTSSEEFRATVQRLTGLNIPRPSMTTTGSTRPRFTFPKGGELLASALAAHNLVRPQPKRANLETSMAACSSQTTTSQSYCGSYPSSPNKLPEFHANSHVSVAATVQQQPPAHNTTSAVPPAVTSRAAPEQQLSNLDFHKIKHQSKLVADRDINIAKLYGALAGGSSTTSRSSSRTAAAAAPPMTTISSTTAATASQLVTDNSSTAPAAAALKVTMMPSSPLMDQEQLKSTSVRLAASSNLRRTGRPLKLDAADLRLSGSSSTSSYGATSAPASRLIRDTSTSHSNNLMLSETRQTVVQDFLRSSSDSSRYQATASNAERGLAKLRGAAQLPQQQQQQQQHPVKEDQNQQSRQQQQLSFSQLDRWFQSDQAVGGPTGSNLIRS
ncbi:hypothetical protein CY35_09G019700 [Sphagnum magellanicum]|nr:hypothetical protein CY35_09G019700 [Sphagnum magellanicum]